MRSHNVPILGEGVDYVHSIFSCETIEKVNILGKKFSMVKYGQISELTGGLWA